MLFLHECILCELGFDLDFVAKPAALRNALSYILVLISYLSVFTDSLFFLNYYFVNIVPCCQGVGPVLGLIFVPLLGSLSDRWSSHYGRRRPFIWVLCVGVLLSLVVIPRSSHIASLFSEQHQHGYAHLN